MPYTVFKYCGLEGVSSSLLRSRLTVTDRAFSSTNSAPSVQTRSTSVLRDRVCPRFSIKIRSSFCSVLLSYMI